MYQRRVPQGMPGSGLGLLASSPLFQRQPTAGTPPPIPPAFPQVPPIMQQQGNSGLLGGLLGGGEGIQSGLGVLSQLLGGQTINPITGGNYMPGPLNRFSGLLGHI